MRALDWQKMIDTLTGTESITLPETPQTKRSLVKVRCSAGHEWIGTVESCIRPRGFRLNAPYHCMYCHGYKPLLNRPAHEWREMYLTLKEAAFVTPASEVTGGGSRVTICCAKGHEWTGPLARSVKPSRYALHAFFYCFRCDDSAHRGPKAPEAWQRYASRMKGATLSPVSPTALEDLRTAADRVTFLCSKGHEWSGPLSTATEHAGYTAAPVFHCRECHPRKSSRSRGEEEVLLLLRSLTDARVRSNMRPIHFLGKPRELDCYIPHLQLAVEYNGDYFHSTKVVFPKLGVTAPAYHELKREACRAKGISLAFVWESDWKQNRDEVEDALKRFVASGGKCLSPLLRRTVSRLEAEAA